MRIALFTNLIAYALVVGQPLAYIVFLGKAQRALSAPAYIELRQRINAVMNRRVPVIYLGAIAAGLLSFGLSLRGRDWTVLVTAAVALLCLLLDLVLMMRENVPINGVMDRWSTTSYPEDWEQYRRRWFAVFRSRQVLLLVGFSSVLAGAVFR